jgi:hypothetical protein
MTFYTVGGVTYGRQGDYFLFFGNCMGIEAQINQKRKQAASADFERQTAVAVTDPSTASAFGGGGTVTATGGLVVQEGKLSARSVLNVHVDEDGRAFYHVAERHLERR